MYINDQFSCILTPNISVSNPGLAPGAPGAAGSEGTYEINSGDPGEAVALSVSSAYGQALRTSLRVLYTRADGDPIICPCSSPKAC